MSWHSIRGHDAVVASLKRGLGRGRFPHALLFVGPEGVGKRSVALKLAQALLCERSDEADLDPCEACPSCLQVKAGNHPDLLLVARPAERHELPIAVIRDLCLDLGLKPMRGGRKIALVDDADDLNDEAANAFLKTLEEPPPASTLILIATSAEAQLETILSRCRVVRFDPLPELELAAVLQEQGVTSDPIEAARLAKLGDGSVSRARGLASPDVETFRRDLLETLADPRGFDPPALAKRVLEFVNEAGKESIDRRQRAGLLMGELSRFFRGIMWQTAGLAPPTTDPDDHRAITALAERLEPADVLVLADRTLEADYQIQRKAYMPLILEALTHDLGVLINPPRLSVRCLEALQRGASDIPNSFTRWTARDLPSTMTARWVERPAETRHDSHTTPAARGCNMLGVPSVSRRHRLGLALAALILLIPALQAPAQEAKKKAPPESATTPKPRDGNWTKMHEAFLERAGKGDVDLLFLGDSITQGWNGAQPVWDRFYGPRNAANFGIGGDKTQNVLWRLDNGELEGIKPKVVVLMIGTNNSGANPADEIAAGIEAIVKRLHEKLPETKVLLLAVFPRGEMPNNPGRNKLTLVNERIAKLNDGKTVRYLDIGPKLTNEDGTISKEIMPDFLHLTRKGYRIWADAIEPTLWSMLDEK